VDWIRSSDVSSSLAQLVGSSSDVSYRVTAFYVSDVSNPSPAIYTSDKLLRLRQQKMYRMKKGFIIAFERVNPCSLSPSKPSEQFPTM
jgi:hypothetical protein